MATIALPYDDVVTRILVNSEITGEQMRSLRAAFGDQPITRIAYDQAVTSILADWPMRKLRRCMERAHELYRRAEVAAAPPPMVDDREILRLLSHAMTIRITAKRWKDLLHYRRGPNLMVRLEYDGGQPNPHIPPAYFRDFTHLGGSRDAFVAFLEGKGARAGRG